jgi:hypothetical protein
VRIDLKKKDIIAENIIEAIQFGFFLADHLENPPFCFNGMGKLKPYVFREELNLTHQEFT